MSFCASCGRQRDDTSRFCGGCGMEFGDTSVASDDKGSAEGMTRTDAAPGGTRVEPSAEQPDPLFASWYYKEPGNSSGDAGSTWQPTETALPTPPKAAGQSSSVFAEANPFTAGNPFSSANPVGAPAPPFPPGPLPVPPQRGGGGRKGLFVVLAVLVVLAAGGGAYALASQLGKHSTGQPPTAPTVTASTPAGSSPTGGTTQHSSSPASSASATPSPTLSLVAIASGVTGTAEPQVETLLSHYFHGINTHDYAEYVSTLNPEQQAKQTQSEFNSGYSSTTDSGMTLTALTDNGNGLTATVSFTSRQSPAQSVDNSACNAWTLNLYLVSQGSGYLIGPAPSGYQPTYSNC
jgi:hypothetical protein